MLYFLGNDTSLLRLIFDVSCADLWAFVSIPNGFAAGVATVLCAQLRRNPALARERVSDMNETLNSSRGFSALAASDDEN